MRPTPGGFVSRFRESACGAELIGAATEVAPQALPTGFARLVEESLIHVPGERGLLD